MRHLAILLAFLLLGVCAGAAVLQEVTADDRIYDEVIRRLADDRDIKGNAFDITVKEGVVTVKGAVTRDKHRQKAEKIIKKVRGVKQIINELIIKEF